MEIVNRIASLLIVNGHKSKLDDMCSEYKTLYVEGHSYISNVVIANDGSGFLVSCRKATGDTFDSIRKALSDESKANMHLCHRTRVFAFPFLSQVVELINMSKPKTNTANLKNKPLDIANEIATKIQTEMLGVNSTCLTSESEEGKSFLISMKVLNHKVVRRAEIGKIRVRIYLKRWVKPETFWSYVPERHKSEVVFYERKRYFSIRYAGTALLIIQKINKAGY